MNDPPPLDPADVVEAQTDIGPILLQRGADLVTPYVLEHGTYARDVSALIRRALEPGMTFVDAGANIGWFSVLASQVVGPEGRVISIEPDDFNATVLEANLARHDAEPVVHRVAAWSERTELTIRPNPDGGAGVAVATGEEGLAHISAERLDELVDGSVDFLKVDCELTDHLVVAGAEKLIRANPSILITVEFSPQHGSHTGHSPADILGIYRDLSLEPYRILGRGGLHPTSYEALLKAGPRNQVSLLDFALSPTPPEHLIDRRNPREVASDLVRALRR